MKQTKILCGQLNCSVKLANGCSSHPRGKSLPFFSLRTASSWNAGKFYQTVIRSAKNLRLFQCQINISEPLTASAQFNIVALQEHAPHNVIFTNLLFHNFNHDLTQILTRIIVLSQRYQPSTVYCYNLLNLCQAFCTLVLSFPLFANLALFPKLTAHKAVSDKLGLNLIFRGACKNTSYAKQYIAAWVIWN